MKAELWQQVREVLDRAIALPAAERSIYLDSACGGDPNLRHEVESLLRSHDEAGSVFLKNPAADVKNAFSDLATKASRVGRRIGAYQIVEEIGHGGMGEVYRALRADGQYEKEVALKLVRIGLDTPALLERVRHERQILASLDHPNIARLLDGGTVDGLPYLVMEMVEGTSIHEYCDAHKLTISQRLELFLKVCGTVQYAHQRLVIHRDIKPSNILVTSEGVPKLLDFGIAKILGPAGDTETTLLHPMTPEYASPEQVRGEAITTSTDVYSLGVVLYRLLTGRSPYRMENRSPVGLSEAIIHDEPERPSDSVGRSEKLVCDGERQEITPESVSGTRELTPARLRQRLKGDLDFVLLKALRKEPAQRYSSVERFGDDIQRHLNGLPVTARKGTWSYHAGKFFKRHRVGFAATAMIFATLVAGIVITVREARIAEANRRRAEARFNDVRRLAHTLMFQVHDSIRDLPGATAARKLIVQSGQEYLDVLAKDSQADSSLLRELAEAYSKLASVQGDIRDANLGDSATALKNRRKSVELLTACASREPSNVGCLVQLAGAQRDLSLALAVNGDKQGSKDAASRAVEIMEPLVSAEPRNQKIQSELADDYEEVANSSVDENDFTKALQFYGKSLNLHEHLAADAPSNQEYQQGVAFNHKHIASILAVQKQYDAALNHYRTALAIDEKLLALDPQNVRKRYNITYSYSDIGWVFTSRGEFQAALNSYEKALQIRLALGAADPNDIRTKDGIGNTYGYMAEIYDKKGDFRRSLRLFREVFSIRQMLLQKDPNNELFRSKVAQTQKDIGETYSDMATHTHSRPSQQINLCREANLWMQRALPVYEQLRSQGKLRGNEISMAEELAKNIEECNRTINRISRLSDTHSQ